MISIADSSCDDTHETISAANTQLEMHNKLNIRKRKQFTYRITLYSLHNLYKVYASRYALLIAVVIRIAKLANGYSILQMCVYV